MVFSNLKQLWKGFRHLEKPLSLLRRFSVAFRGLWHIQNGLGGHWQFKTIPGRFKTLVGAFDTF